MTENKVERADSRGNEISVSINCSSFPAKLFIEWDKDCKERFNDCRWMKIWHDHMTAKNFEAVTKLMESVVPEKEPESVPQKTEEKKKTVLIGGKEI